MTAVSITTENRSALVEDLIEVIAQNPTGAVYFHLAQAYKLKDDLAASAKALEEAIAAGKLPFLTVEGIVPMQGGLPVVVEDKIIGAVGVSGVTSAQDEQVALAALSGLSG